MLDFELTKHHTGLILWGDYWSLNRLYNFIHKVVDQSITIKDKEGFVLGLAYDVRKANEGQRQKGFRKHYEEKCRIYGVEILWPVLIIQTGMLRHAMGYIQTTREDQSIMFELEHIIESALQAAVPLTTAKEIMASMERICSLPYDHIAAILDSRCCYFIEQPADKRLSILSKLLYTFDFMYSEAITTSKITSINMIPPSAFVNEGREWPDFKW